MLSAICTDITTLKVDVIVNAANNSLLGGGGVDGAIHQAAGPDLLRFCHQLNGCETGHAKITPGFYLAAKRVIHTVGPIWQGGEHDEASLLESCYRNSLELALQYELKTIAFASISTGVYGYPKQQAAEIAVKLMRQYEDRFEEIITCCFDDDNFKIYEALLE